MKLEKWWRGEKVSPEKMKPSSEAKSASPTLPKCSSPKFEELLDLPRAEIYVPPSTPWYLVPPSSGADTGAGCKKQILKLRRGRVTQEKEIKKGNSAIKKPLHSL